MQHDTTDAREHYLTAFHRRLSILLAGRTGAHVLDDVIQSEVLHLFERIDAVMANYPDPVAYAIVRGAGGRALIDHVRRDNVQRGRGALAAREVLDGDAVFIALGLAGRSSSSKGSGTNYEQFESRLVDHCDDVTERHESIGLLRSALLQLPADQRRLLLLVDGYGYTVTQAAAALGIRRETAARKRSAALRTLRT